MDVCIQLEENDHCLSYLGLHGSPQFSDQMKIQQRRLLHLHQQVLPLLSVNRGKGVYSLSLLPTLTHTPPTGVIRSSPADSEVGLKAQCQPEQAHSSSPEDVPGPVPRPSVGTPLCLSLQQHQAAGCSLFQSRGKLRPREVRCLPQLYSCRWLSQDLDPGGPAPQPTLLATPLPAGPRLGRRVSPPYFLTCSLPCPSS